MTSQLPSIAARGDMRAYLLKERELAKFYLRPPYYFAVRNAALGEDAQAFEWLNKAYERRDENILYIKVDPEWDHLRSDPRFVAIVRKVGLP